MATSIEVRRPTHHGGLRPGSPAARREAMVRVAGEDDGTDGAEPGAGELDTDLDTDPAAQREADEARQREQEQDKDTSDFKGLVSKRVLALKKEAPELTQIFPEVPEGPGTDRGLVPPRHGLPRALSHDR
jgi:hypothetical protein